MIEITPLLETVEAFLKLVLSVPDFFLPPTYTFDPHRHVKIWLSKDSNSYLNLTNQLRLIKMREVNPSDTIHFIYDSKLLSVTALDELHKFCKQHQIEPHDVRKTIFSACETAEEKTLIALYEDEVGHLNEGGNLAAASDMLRVISPIYSLGTYTDFDVPVNTKDLPPTIKVNQPVLLNFIDTFSGTCFCKDVVAVADPKAALGFIQVIQREMIEKCTAEVLDWMDNLSITWNDVVNKGLSAGFSTREIRGVISNMGYGMMEKIDLDCKSDDFLSMLSLDTEFKLLRISEKELSKIHSYFITEEMMTAAEWRASTDRMTNAELDAYLANLKYGVLKENVLKNLVVDCTGPGIFLNAMKKHAMQNILYDFSTYAFLKKEKNIFKVEYTNVDYILDTLLPYTQSFEMKMYILNRINILLINNRGCDSLDNYQLNTAFKGQMSSNVRCDLSWLPSGQHNMQLVENKMDEKAKIIQRSFKDRLPKIKTDPVSPKKPGVPK